MHCDLTCICLGSRHTAGAQNRYCVTPRHSGSPTPTADSSSTAAIVSALHSQAASAAVRCSAPLIKGHCGMDGAWLQYAAALRAMGARVVATYRKNALDVAVCEVCVQAMRRHHTAAAAAAAALTRPLRSHTLQVRDCLHRDPHLGYPVGTSPASPSPPSPPPAWSRLNCSISRRALPRESQPKVRKRTAGFSLRETPTTSHSSC